MMIEMLKGGLVVSCQALEGEPMYGSSHMAAMAVAAQEGGAVGIRANGESDISAIKARVNLPIIGIRKRRIPGYEAFITPTKADAAKIAAAGAEIIAIDATDRSRPEPLDALIAFIQQELGLRVMADIATLQEAEQAAQMGCDWVGTTLSGYTDATKNCPRPDFPLLVELNEHLSIPFVAEGHISTPAQARKALELGASFVVVGAAITRPQQITRTFVEGMKDR